MKFFVPGVKPSQAQDHYDNLVAVAKEQMRWTITPRRIRELEYVHDKRRYTLTVGAIEPMSKRYEVCAILDSNTYMVVTRDKYSGQPGITIMVAKDEVTREEEFSA